MERYKMTLFIDISDFIFLSFFWKKFYHEEFKNSLKGETFSCTCTASHLLKKWSISINNFYSICIFSNFFVLFIQCLKHMFAEKIERISVSIPILAICCMFVMCCIIAPIKLFDIKIFFHLRLVNMKRIVCINGNINIWRTNIIMKSCLFVR